MNAVSTVVAARMIVLVAVLGAIGLTVLALQAPDAYRLGALLIFAAGVVAPAVYLAARG